MVFRHQVENPHTLYFMTKQSNGPEREHQKTGKSLVIFQSPTNSASGKKKSTDRQNYD